jgi:hypothetical protein
VYHAHESLAALLQIQQHEVPVLRARVSDAPPSAVDLNFMVAHFRFLVVAGHGLLLQRRQQLDHGHSVGDVETQPGWVDLATRRSDDQRSAAGRNPVIIS